MLDSPCALLVVLADIFGTKALRQVEVHLDGTALPVTTEAVLQREFEVDADGVRGCTRSCQNASILSRHSFCTLLNMFSLYLSAWPDLSHKVLWRLRRLPHRLGYGKRVCPQHSPCIAVRRDHFEVAAISAYYGRSPHYRVGRTIFWGQSAAHTLAAHLPEPSLASRVLSPRGHL